jgi:hypothetical protein
LRRAAGAASVSYPKPSHLFLTHAACSARAPAQRLRCAPTTSRRSRQRLRRCAASRHAQQAPTRAAALTHVAQMASALEALDFPTDDDWRRLEQARACRAAAAPEPRLTAATPPQVREKELSNRVRRATPRRASPSPVADELEEAAAPAAPAPARQSRNRASQEEARFTAAACGLGRSSADAVCHADAVRERRGAHAAGRAVAQLVRKQHVASRQGQGARRQGGAHPARAKQQLAAANGCG